MSDFVPPGDETPEEAKEKLNKFKINQHWTEEDRREISRLSTIEYWDKVLFYKETGQNRLPQCNRYTNGPCYWSNTHWLEDTCAKCGYQFPSWG